MTVTLKGTSYLTPIFLVLFPGIDPTKNFQELRAIMGKSIEKGTFICIPKGQGQEDQANKMLEECSKE